jgi:hypothetical protein
MIRMTKHRRRLAAAALSAACLAVGLPATATASTRPDDRPGLRAPATAPVVQQLVRPDDRGGVRGLVSTSRVTHAVVATSRTFDWGDAATGGSVTLGAISLLGLAAFAGRRRGRAAHPTVTSFERSA